MGETPYVETEVLLAVMNDDDERLQALLRDMLPGERGTLWRQLDRAMMAINNFAPKTEGEARR